jgi:hypothetical protein
LSFTTLTQIEEAIRAAWCRETSDDPDEWTPDDPARGQCGVAALVLRDYLGGDLLIAEVIPADGGKPTERHCWNRLSSGTEIDLTREQFQNGETFGEAVVQEPLVMTRGKERYVLLATRVRERLQRGFPAIA